MKRAVSVEDQVSKLEATGQYFCSVSPRERADLARKRHM
jgi:hypothetical protein